MSVCLSVHLTSTFSSALKKKVNSNKVNNLECGIILNLDIQGIHVALAKAKYERRIDAQTDNKQSDPYMEVYFTGTTKNLFGC